MMDTNPTVRLTTDDHDFEHALRLRAHETNLLIALHAYDRQSSGESREMAMRALDQLVDTMHDAGWSPEQTVIAIKELARRSGVLRGDVDFSQRIILQDKDLLAEELVSAAIRRFFQRA